jgi:hypothetical protein
MLRPPLHLSQSNAVLDGLPINRDGELGHGTGCRLERAGGTKFGDSMSDGFVEGISVNLNGVENSILIGERDATASHTGIIALCSSFVRLAFDAGSRRPLTA